MATKKLKPTTAGRRDAVVDDFSDITTADPYKPLLAPLTKKGGRNNKGRITVRHRGGGHKKLYRIIDFKRNLDGIPAKVHNIEYDPNRSAHIALIVYSNGKWSYIISSASLKAGDFVQNGPDAPLKSGNFLPIKNIPQGTVISCIECSPKGGAKLCRSAGAYANLVSKDHQYALIKLRSGEVRKWVGLQPKEVEKDCEPLTVIPTQEADSYIWIQKPF